MNIVNYIERVRSGYVDKQTYDIALKDLRVLRNSPNNQTESSQSRATRLRIGLSEPEDDSESTLPSIPMACRFARVQGNEDVLAIANEDGYVLIENTSFEQKKPLYSFSAHNNAVFDMSWSDCDNRLLFGAGDHSASIWDISESRATKIRQFVEHTQSLKSVCFRPLDKDVFATGARDGLILMWDARSSSSNVMQIKPENCILNMHSIATGIHQIDSPKGRSRRKVTVRIDSIAALLFQDSCTLLSSSVSEGFIKVWDMRKSYSTYKRVPQPVYKLEHPTDPERNCFTSLCLDTTGVRLYANCMDGSIYCYNVASYNTKPVMSYNGHQVYTLYVKCCLSPDGNYIVSGSSDKRAYIWRTDRPGKPILSLNGHHSEVTYVDWCRKGEIKIATCSDDVPIDASDTAMLWRVFTEKEAVSEIELKNKTIGWTEVNEVPVVRRTALPRRPVTFKQINLNNDPRRNEMSSPTSNLPNYVVDGTSPYHCCSSSSASKRDQKENRDWLTDIRQRTPTSLNGKSMQMKKRSQGSVKPKACGNLLKFFKVAGKQGSSDLNNMKSAGTSFKECIQELL